MRVKSATLFAAVIASVCLVTSMAPVRAAPGGGGGGHKPDGCVTRSEYDKVDQNMTRKAVHKRFGTSGHRESITQSGGRATEVRSYDVCHSPDSTVTVTFEKGPHGPFKLQSKTAVFVG
jgi:hypothetical protein